jgi:hypothetical protein
MVSCIMQAYMNIMFLLSNVSYCDVIRHALIHGGRCIDATSNGVSTRDTQESGVQIQTFSNRIHLQRQVLDIQIIRWC